MNNLAVLENQLKPLAPRLEMVLDKRVPVQRLMQTIMISCERLPKLFECDRQSLFNAAMSAAVLGLEVDGVTGQAYLIPFKGKAQLVVGYKGYNTLAARSGITITGEVVREGDDFDYDLGEGWVKHKPALAARGASSARGQRPRRTGARPSSMVMSIDELMAVKRSRPARAQRQPVERSFHRLPGDVRENRQAPARALDAAQRDAARRAHGRSAR
jgi:recombination protein RecT